MSMPNSRPSLRRAVAVLVAALAVAAAGVAAGAGLLRFGLDRLLFPPTPATPGAVEALRVSAEDGSALVAHRSGSGQAGCVVWFPDGHGADGPGQRSLFDEATRAGLAVYAIAYPGQDGAPGHGGIALARMLAPRAVRAVVARCDATRTVVAGSALGAMVAAFAANGTHPAGLVLESASPSLLAAVRAHLRGRWFLAPLVLLPLDRLAPPDIRADVTLADAIPTGLHAVIFQGSADTQAPLRDLASDDAGLQNLPIVEVPGGTHADTLARARPAVIATVLDMIRGSQAEAAAGNEDN